MDSATSRGMTACLDSRFRGNNENDSNTPKLHLFLQHFPITKTDQTWVVSYKNHRTPAPLLPPSHANKKFLAQM